MSPDFISEWKSEISDTLWHSKSLCLAVYSTDRSLLFCNDAFSTLISDDPCSSLINPTFDKIVGFNNTTDLVFSGYLTVGSKHSVNTSIFANIYRKKDQFIVIGGIDIIMLLEQNKAVLNMNAEINKLQREVIKKNKQLQKTNEELDVANESLHNLNATKDKFFGIIAHDLKNPFNSILGFSDLLLSNIHHYDKNKILDFVKIIRSASRSAYHLLENLLVWARSQSGKIEFNPTPNNLSKIINQNISLLEIQSTKKEIKVTTKIDKQYTVLCDLNMINTVVRNLLTNAIKFTNPHGRITISAIQIDNECEITISDTGTGISPENLLKLFTIDSKFQKKGTNDEKGTGLGLILCKEFIEKHGGRIWVESQIEKGSNFKFTMPLYIEKTENITQVYSMI